MAHAAKYPRSSAGHLCDHYERKKVDGEYIKFKNQDIDPKRTPSNYNLAPDRGIGQAETIRQRLADPEVHMQQRKDVNVMCSWVVTLPQGLEPGEHREFMEQTYKFLCDRYGGEKNVISAYVHMDEARPHMHFAFIPIVEDKTKGGYKVSAKNVFHLRELKAFHNDLSKHMTAHYGRDIGILNDATEDGNKSIEELKRGEAEKTVAELRREIARLEPKVQELREEYGVYREYQVQDAPRIEAKPVPLSKGMVMVKADELEIVVKAADAYRMNRHEVMHARNAQKALSERETVIGDREARIERRENALEARERKAEGLLRRFKNIGKSQCALDDLERQRNDLQEKNQTLAGERDIAKAETVQVKVEYNKLVDEYNALESVYQKVRTSFVDTVRSFRAFFYADEGTGLRARFTDFQRAVFKGISKKAQQDFLSLGDEPAAAVMISKTSIVDEGIIKHAKIEVQQER